MTQKEWMVEELDQEELLEELAENPDFIWRILYPDFDPHKETIMQYMYRAHFSKAAEIADALYIKNHCGE